MTTAKTIATAITTTTVTTTTAATAAADAAASTMSVLIVAWCLLASASVFGHRTLKFEIFEEQPIGSVVGNVRQDSGLVGQYRQNKDVLKQLQFHVRHHNIYFDVGETSGDVTSKAIVDRERICPYMESCLVHLEVAIKPLIYFQIIKIEVEIKDINDHAPAFHKDRFSLDIIETTLPGSQFPIPSAEDADSDQLSIHRYQLIADTDLFELNVTKQVDGSHDVRLKLCRHLDREIQDYFSVTVVAFDGGAPVRSASMLLDIYIQDANDNNPQFDLSLYEERIYENLPLGTSVLSVRAYDPDVGLNGMVRYSFAEETEQRMPSNHHHQHLQQQQHHQAPLVFAINATTGVITVNGPIDYEKDIVFSLTVVASDLGPNSLPTFSKVVLYVVDVNDNPPKILLNLLTSSRYAQVPENAPVGTFVSHVAVSDADSSVTGNGRVDCSIDSVDFRLETIYPSEFKLVTAKVFDREAETQHALSIRCHDNGLPRLMASTKTLVVQVTDENDNSPRMSSDVFFVSLAENNALEAFVIRMNATDADIGRNAALRYKLEALNGTPRESLAIDSLSGRISASLVFDYEKRQSYSYLVTVRDGGDPSRSTQATLVLNLIDVNDELPQFESPVYELTTAENRPIGSLLGKVKAFDADASFEFHRVFYSLEGPTAAAKQFRIDNLTGEIYNLVILDHEQISLIRLRICASNEPAPWNPLLLLPPPPPHHQFTLSSTAVNVTIYVTDENDNPPSIVSPSSANETFYIWMDVPSGYIVTKLEVIDPDEGLNGLLTFRMDAGNDRRLFHINEFSGDVTCRVDVSVEEAHLHWLFIVVHDNGSPRLTASVSLFVVVNASAQQLFVKSSATAGGGGEGGGESASDVALRSDSLMVVIVIASGAIVVIKVVAITLVCLRVHAAAARATKEVVVGGGGRGRHKTNRDNNDDNGLLYNQTLGEAGATVDAATALQEGMLSSPSPVIAWSAPVGPSSSPPPTPLQGVGVGAAGLRRVASTADQLSDSSLNDLRMAATMARDNKTKKEVTFRLDFERSITRDSLLVRRETDFTSTQLPPFHWVSSIAFLRVFIFFILGLVVTILPHHFISLSD